MQFTRQSLKKGYFFAFWSVSKQFLEGVRLFLWHPKPRFEGSMCNYWKVDKKKYLFGAKSHPEIFSRGQILSDFIFRNDWESVKYPKNDQIAEKIQSCLKFDTKLPFALLRIPGHFSEFSFPNVLKILRKKSFRI